MTNFNFNLLAPLDALLKEKSVTAAANSIGVSQPTMSGMLNRLREQFNDPLLVRVKTGMELTPRAARLKQEVRQLLLGIERLTTPEEAFVPADCERHFRIMTSEAGIFLIIVPFFRKVSQAAPKLTFEIVPIERPIERVYAGEVDFCITGDTIEDAVGGPASFVRAQTLYHESFVAIVDEDHPLRDAITFEDMLIYPHVATQFPGSPRTVEDIGVRDFSRDYPPRLRVPGFLAIGAAVSESNAIGIIPSRLIPMAARGWRLRVLKLPREFPTFPVRALWHSRYDQDAGHRWLRTEITKVCAGWPVPSEI